MSAQWCDFISAADVMSGQKYASESPHSATFLSESVCLDIGKASHVTAVVFLIYKMLKLLSLSY